MTDKKNTSEAVEDFLKAVYVLEQALSTQEGRVSTNALRDVLSISAPSVTDMAQRLHDEGYIDYVRYQGVRLTPSGERLALNVLRRHRLIELYLVQELGYALHEVHEEAEKIEHAVSEAFIEAISHKLGHPTLDPHGDPIPNQEGVMMSAPALLPLAEAPLQALSRVSRFVTSDPQLLQHAQDKGFKLQKMVCILSREPFEGPLTIRLSDEVLTVGHTLAQSILVEVL